jgi:hypothetical protein
MAFREAEQRFLLLFLEKEEYRLIQRQFKIDHLSWNLAFCEAEQRFLLLFLKKEGYRLI